MTIGRSSKRPPKGPQRGLWQALALNSDHTESESITFASTIAQLSLAWTVAFILQVAAVTTIATSVILAERIDMIERIVLEGSAVIALGLLALILLKCPPTSHWQPFRHVRLAVIYGAGLGALLTSLLWESGALSINRMELGCFVAVLGAIGVTAMALHPVRAALLSYAAGIVVMIAILAGPGVGTYIACGCLVCLGMATRRLALMDSAHAIHQSRDVAEGMLAARLVHEYETQGTGWFWQTDRDGVITYLSPKVALAVSGPDQPAIGQPLNTIFKIDNVSPGTERTLGFHLSSRTGFSDYPVRPAAFGTSDNWWSMSGRPVIDAQGKFQGFIGSGNDLTEKRRSEAEITKLALFDGLTGLANRQRMRVSLDQTLSQPSTHYRPTSLLLLDLDRFKVVNDTLGHQIGDALLKQVAQRLMRTIGDAGLVGRLGGDEFQVVLPDEDSVETLSDMSRSVIAALSQPYAIDGNTISIGCSIGVAIAPRDGADSETLVRNADLALYAAKADGRGVHRFYREELLHGAQNRKQLEDDLRHALVKNQFHLVYQPVVCTESARIMGYEALLRWEHPTRGGISPADFIPVAEDCGLIESIGEWVLRTACLDAAKWPRHVRVGVNVSPIQFANPALPGIVNSALAKAGIAPGRLELEITEGVFLDESASSEAMFKALKAIGVRLALDDFGTGYSSLGYLRSAPFDKIKIDQSFVRGAAQAGNRNAAIIKAIVTLAKTMQMETTAEGVETQDEIELIRELGCSHIQGFVYGRPLLAEDVIKLLTDGGGMATAIGYKTSRSQRTTVMRSALLRIGTVEGEVRIRNISTTGAMIDGIDFGRNAENTPLEIEVIEGQMLNARVMWNRDGKAGIAFDQPFNTDVLNAALESRLARLAA
ncbi:bifunctional diguanylate cyclase/phosphodiesterase [Sphingomonas sp. 32-62-10]|nr:MAG: diguanylate cyclase [Sphingomonas sp. 32-62-10]